MAVRHDIQEPQVSVIIIFLNAEKFIEEAIQSVLAQTYHNWELLLVDDGSTDASTTIAQGFAEQRPQQIYYLEHPDHQNCGKGASRNLGIDHAKGKFIAFLDADDVWLPHKLEEQVVIIEANPEVGMLYGDTLYWYSWTGNPADIQRDFTPKLGVESDTLIEPPKLLPLFLRGKAAVPCTCSILIKRDVAREVGGFEEAFRGIYNIYEDQAFYAKVCLKTSGWAVNRCWDKYRQHAGASVAIAHVTQQEYEARYFFLKWLGDYISQEGIEDKAVWEALRKELWLKQRPAWLPASGRLPSLVRWLKKWFLRVEERILPLSIRRWLWVRG
jgi:glycosyltransferase involved in cell wall biosynthesis